HLGSAEATVDDVEPLEVLLQGFPHADGGATDEDHPARGRRLLSIRRFERLDVRLPPIGLRRGRGGRRCARAPRRSQRSGEHQSRKRCRPAIAHASASRSPSPLMPPHGTLTPRLLPPPISKMTAVGLPWLSSS